jgi:hypothetical protein
MCLTKSGQEYKVLLGKKLVGTFVGYPFSALSGPTTPKVGYFLVTLGPVEPKDWTHRIILHRFRDFLFDAPFIVAEAGKKEGETYYLIGCELPHPPRETMLLWLRTPYLHLRGGPRVTVYPR